MDAQLAASFLKLIIFLPVVILLAYISLKLGGQKMLNGGSRIIKIIERVPITSKSYLCVAVINGKPYIVSSSEEKVEILMELPMETMEKYKREGSFKDNFLENLNLFINRKERP
ncbi:hypothetical protein OXPF_17860 [Oxobacter pfennigii]|uniref:Flagellar protein n=1 Tax=Oxobacter pfennigii TaxID=36849 RepID=A0A0P8YY60_9CLOT|nr:flagellar biosynthetic protein FliO [Oxobacter pfennigii]KPU44700.1 hypothetical protein OXPF_17860 [Oxobacter pfennigii]